MDGRRRTLQVSKDGGHMIRLTRLSGASFVLNCDLIERIDQTPDTVITLGDGTKYVAAEDIDTVVRATRLHRAEIIAMSDVLRVHMGDTIADLVDGDAADDETDGHRLASVTDLQAAAAGARRVEGGEV